MGKGEIHYIEVAIDNYEEELGSQAQDNKSTSSEEEPLHEEEQPPRRPQTQVKQQPREKAKRQAPKKGGVIATLSRVPRYDTLRIRGTI